MPVNDGAPAPADDKAKAAAAAQPAKEKVETLRVIVADNRTVTDGSGKVHHPGAELDLPLTDATLVLANGFAVKPGSKVEQRPLPGERDDTK